MPRLGRTGVLACGHQCRLLTHSVLPLPLSSVFLEVNVYTYNNQPPDANMPHLSFKSTENAQLPSVQDDRFSF